MIRSRTLPFTFLLVLLAALLAAGCGGDDSSDSGGDSGGGDTSAETDAGEDGADAGGGDIDAQSLFTSSCGGCHTLADAGTSGSVGPNLDDAGPDEDTVRTMIAEGGGAMPAGLLEGEEADAVAAYVAENAGG